MSLQDALHAARRAQRELADATARARQEKLDQAERELQLRLEAVGYLAPLGGERLVQVDSDEICLPVGVFAGGDRFQSPDGRRWCVVDEQPCWIVGDEIDRITDPVLLLADGRVGQFTPDPAGLTRLDPRRDGHEGREFVSYIPLGGPPRWTLTEEMLAHMIVRYERAHADRARRGPH
ncbi:hypothetical protein [Amycolatopsis sp. PS_44_ISF1]|uniref:hypothetical protein n=1 Tax=Amycolatopsis sp. PS_44_ISF1 TaxID=2974917 RepID=UPI0028DF1A2B|nr:hypothetical protein [Amycolatopsis sp. PS_44_ISF1]MDT8916255.1 hypothetical protein [Amycolatopsis sp. PS_44_ISF1]